MLSYSNATLSPLLEISFKTSWIYTSTSGQVSHCDGFVLQIYFGSQIPVTTGDFELDVSCIQSSYVMKQILFCW